MPINVLRKKEKSMEVITDNLIQIAEFLYQENIPIAYQQLRVALPTLETVINEIEQEETRNLMKDKLLQALKAMEDEDYILLADTIQYEIVEELQNIN